MDLSPIVPSSVVASSPVMYLPQPIQNVFASAQYCYLATCVGDSPHLSLMHFSHTDDPELGNIIVLSTRRDTKKFNALVANPKVAVLIHDFDGNRRSKYMAAAAQSTPKSDATDISEAGTASVTVYGVCQVADGELERRLRDLHRSNVPDDQEYFVCGDDVAMLAIVPTQARLCNINDQITTWRPDRSDSFGSAGAGAPCDVPQ